MPYKTQGQERLDKPHEHIMPTPGCYMDLRDWFAGLAMQGILSTDDARYIHLHLHLHLASLARGAYDCADAMIAARQVENAQTSL